MKAVAKQYLRLGQSASGVTRLRGLASVNITPAANSGAFATDLHSWTLPANGLGEDGDTLWYETAGTFANNGNTKALVLAFGTDLVNLYSGVPTGSYWYLRVRITRLGASSQAWSVEYVNSGVGAGGGSSLATVQNHLVNRFTGSLAFSSSQALIVNAQGGATNDVIQKESYVIIGGVP